jgi:UMF1 family MFS transporter
MPGQGQIWSWISFDVANQSFTLLINTVLFSIFFQSVIVRDPARDDTLWSLMGALSMGLVVLASPIAGAMGDARHARKAALVGTGIACAILTCALALLQPGQIWLAFLLYIPANFFFAIGENFLASFLPTVAKPRAYARVSGFSWGVAYTAALVLLVVTAGSMLALGLKDAAQWRPFFVFAGLWFLAFTIPTLLFLREAAPPHSPAAPNATAPHPIALLPEAFRRLTATVRSVRAHRDLATMLVATLLYCTGTYTVIFFASILAKEFGFSDVALIIFIAVLTVAGIVGTAVTTLVQDRWGHRRTTSALLIVWIVASALMAYYAHQHGVHTRALAASAALPSGPPLTPFPTWPMWALGCALGFGLGALGSANRAFVAYLIPATRTGEYFGFWGMVVKLAAVCTIPFGLAKDTWGTPAALVVLTAFFVAGLIATRLVNEQRGAAAARAVEAEANPEADTSTDGVNASAEGVNPPSRHV